MDTSEIYIKMCNCPEIQKEMSSRPKFYLAYCLHGRWQVEHDYLGGQNSPLLLPMQDQIQEMIDWNKSFHAPIKTRIFHSWIFDGSDRAIYCQQFDSLEQLWLAFYMHEKHQKTWDGDKWTKIPT